MLTGLRSLLIAMVLSALLWIFGNPIRQLSLDLMGGGGDLMSEASIYVTTRWWAIPASVSLFAVNGWFAGMQDAKTPMLVAILGNVINVSASAVFAIWGEMGIATYFRVVLPMLKSIMISVGVLEVMWIWNDYLLPYLVLDIRKYKTIPIAVQYLKGGYGSVDMGAMMGVLVLAIIPIFIF